MSETQELLDELECGSLRFHVDNHGRLIVTPKRQLTPAEHLAIERHHDGAHHARSRRPAPDAAGVEELEP